MGAIKELVASLVGGALTTLVSMVWGKALLVALSLYHVGYFYAYWQWLTIPIGVLLIYAYWLWQKPSVIPAVFLIPTIGFLIAARWLWPIESDWHFLGLVVLLTLAAQIAALTLLPTLRVLNRIVK